MNFLRDMARALAILLALLFILSLPLALLGFNLGHTLFDPQALLALTTEHGLREEVIGEAWETAVSNQSLSAIVDPESALGVGLRFAGQNPELREQIVPRDLLVETARQSIANAFAWLNSPDPDPTLDVDLRPYKQHIVDGSDAIINTTLDQLPPCTVEQAAQLAGSLLNDFLFGGGTAVEIPLCLPPDIVLEGVMDAARGVLIEQLRLVPDSVTVQIDAGADAVELARTKALLRLTRFGMAWGWAAVLGVLLVTAVLGGQSVRGFFQWLGWPLLISTTLTLLLALAWLAVGRSLAWWALPDLPAWFAVIVDAVLDGLVGETGQALLWQAAAQGVLGVGALSIAFLFGRQSA